MQTAVALYLGPGDRDKGTSRGRWPSAPSAPEAEDLPYRIDVWDVTGSYPEILVAMTVTAAVAFPACQAAAREYAGRDVSLRHKGRTISRLRAC